MPRPDTAATPATASLTPVQQAVVDKVRNEGFFFCATEIAVARDLVRLGVIRPYWAPPHDSINCFYVPEEHD